MRPEFEYLIKKLTERHDRIAQDLAGGSAKDYAGYQYLAGMANGLQTAIREIAEYGKAYDAED